MIRASLIALLLVLCGVAPSSADEASHVRVTAATRMTGAVETVALHFTIDPGWHIYWINPGETGLPTAITWTLPSGITAGHPQFPVPERFVTGQLVNYGYAGEGTVLAPLRLSTAAPGGRAQASITWLVCAHMCIPGSAILPIPLGVNSGDAGLFVSGQMPQRFDGTADVQAKAGSVTLRLAAPALMRVPLSDIVFFPSTPRAVDDRAAPQLARNGQSVTLTFHRARHPHPLSAFSGVLKIDGEGAWLVNAKLGAVSGGAAEPPSSAMMSVLFAIAFAFAGGLILNLMPCVLPILSMKALAFAEEKESAAELRREGLFYFGGVIASFMIIASALLILRMAGHSAGWGFQLQSPSIVALLALLCAAVGLNLLGLFELPAGLAGAGGGLTASGSAGQRAFFTGVLAVLVASPCTAPFMGTAMGFALTQPAGVALAIFLALAIGFALPFAALTFLPRLVQLIPRPGPWMIVLKEFLAFPMLATAIWLIWVLAQEAGPGGVALTLACALGLAFMLWTQSRAEHPSASPLILAGSVAVLAALIAMMPGAPSAAPAPRSGEAWAAWSPQAVAQARAAGHPVLVDFGAAWCVTCLVNEQIALHNPAVHQRLVRQGVVTLKADWTNRDARIGAVLQSYGRAGVPLYLLYPADPAAKAEVLPEILTPNQVIASVSSLAAEPH